MIDTARFLSETLAVALAPTEHDRHRQAVDLMRRTLRSAGYTGVDRLVDAGALECPSRCPSGECWAADEMGI